MNHSTGRLLGLTLLMPAALVASVLPVAVVAPAQAEPPPNDDISGATAITTAPETWTFDTSEATSDPTDGRCVGDKSVWFTFRAEFGQRLRMTTAGSSFDTQLALFDGRRAERRLVECDDDGGPGRTSAGNERLRAGHRYWIAVSSETLGEGGLAVLTIGKVGPPEVEITVDQVRSGAVSGRLIVDAIIDCSTPADLRLSAIASQRVGEHVARGSSGSAQRYCEGALSVAVNVDSDTGFAFQPGPVAILLRLSGWDGVSRFRARTEQIATAVDDPAARPAV